MRETISQFKLLVGDWAWINVKRQVVMMLNDYSLQTGIII